MFPHHEDTGIPFGRRAQAGLQCGEELLLPKRALGLLPGVRRFLPVATAVKLGIELGGFALRIELRDRLFVALAPDRVHDLVLEYSRQPGAQVGAPCKVCFACEGRQQSFLDRILGGGGVAQLQRGIAQQVGPQTLDLAAESGGLGESGQGED